MQLDGRVATVTGAGRGIGEAIARTFARAGAAVVVSDRDAGTAEAVARSIAAAGGRAAWLQVDVSKPADAEALAQKAVDAFGRLDIHVNNAGMAIVKPFLETTHAEFERVLQVNLLGAFLCAQAAVRRMLTRGYGRVINVTSISGQRGGYGRSAYGSSKAGLDLLSRVMSVELAASGITINNIAPGAVATDMAKEVHDPAAQAAYRYLTPRRRYATAQDIADAALFLASDAAAHICGHTLNVDGGYGTAGLMHAAPGSPTPPEV